MVNEKTKHNAISPKKRLGYGYFIAAVIFLFNPCINIVDILPDFFGYMFLLKGLEKWADLCPNIADAVQGIGKLRWYMLIKLPAIILIPIMRDDTFTLLLTFAFILIELIYAIPAAGRIFDGLEYFGTRFDGQAVFNGLKDLRLLTNIFFISKSALCLIPELTSLSSYEYSGYITSTPQFDLSQYKNLFLLAGVLLSLLIGILWLINTLPYINRISKDTPFLERILHDYDLEITENVGISIRRRLHTAIVFLVAGFVFFLNIWFDSVNVIPTFIGALFIISALLKLKKLSSVSGVSIAASVIFALVSAVTFAVSFTFSVKYDLRAITLGVADPEVVELYNLCVTLSVIEHIVMGLTTLIVLHEIIKLAKAHLSPDPDIKDKRLITIYENHLHSIRNSIIISAVLFVIALCTNAVYNFMRADINAAFWLVPFIMTGIWLAYTVNTLWQLYSQIEYKYT